MATAATRRFKPPTSFTIREDTPTEDDNASMAMDEDAETEERTDVEPEEGESDNESSFSESGASEDDAVSDQVTQDMIKLQEGIPGFKDKFRLIKRIGEGMAPNWTLRNLKKLTDFRDILHRLQSRRPRVRQLQKRLGLRGKRKGQMDPSSAKTARPRTRPHALPPP